MNHIEISRRRFVGNSLAVGIGLLGARVGRGAEEDQLPPVRTITREPKYHWFGYYDKLEFDPSGRYVLGMGVDFEHRSPKPDDVIEIGMVDLQDGDRWITLGRSTAWCWQQGCMLQWIPGSKTKILWNDREDQAGINSRSPVNDQRTAGIYSRNARYVCRILDVHTRELRTIPHPIYALSPDGKTAVSTDFSRVGDVRPGYGYNGIPDPYADDPAPKESGITRVNLETGKHELILSLADIVRFGRALPTMKKTKHAVYHLLFNPDGSRFIFLHRWQVGKGRETRMFTAAPDGSDMRIVDDNGLTSHFIWRDPKHILAWSNQPSQGKALYLFEDGGKKVEAVGTEAMKLDGHCSYLPGNEWILNDTYPDDQRFQHPYLYHVKTGRVVPLGHFRSPPEYIGEWRCDTHPRFSPNGRSIVIDSPHTGGRQLHLIDISKIVG